MPNNTPGLRQDQQTKGIQPEPLQVTRAEFPDVSFDRTGEGDLIRFDDWCAIQVERIRKIPGRAPRIALAKSQSGKYEGKIMVVDDLFILPDRIEITDRSKIRSFHYSGPRMQRRGKRGFWRDITS